MTCVSGLAAHHWFDMLQTVFFGEMAGLEKQMGLCCRAVRVSQ